jgi:hypothetical protein
MPFTKDCNLSEMLIVIYIGNADLVELRPKQCRVSGYISGCVSWTVHGTYDKRCHEASDLTGDSDMIKFERQSEC